MTHSTHESPQSRLQRLLDEPEGDLNLAEAALWIAKTEYPELDIAAYMQHLDELAQRVWQQLASQARAPNIILTLNQVLFEQEGFAGNTRDYYDPRNSFLNDVLDRKEGIPLTLSIIYLEVGRRLGLPLEGVPFPGHFLVKMAIRDGSMVVLDPFFKGIPLSEEALIERLAKQSSSQHAQPPSLATALRSASKREILLRMLRNLKQIYRHREQWDKLLLIMDLILVMTPAVAEEWRDRGRVYQHLECPRAALEDYRNYLELEPYADDAETIAAQIEKLARESHRLN
jgi:regulator of sirC expression with transglutaminase-like and TPR domain